MLGHPTAEEKSAIGETKPGSLEIGVHVFILSAAVSPPLPIGLLLWAGCTGRHSSSSRRSMTSVLWDGTMRQNISLNCCITVMSYFTAFRILINPLEAALVVHYVSSCTCTHLTRLAESSLPPPFITRLSSRAPHLPLLLALLASYPWTHRAVSEKRFRAPKYMMLS